MAKWFVGRWDLLPLKTSGLLTSRAWKDPVEANRTNGPQFFQGYGTVMIEIGTCQ